MRIFSLLWGGAIFWYVSLVSLTDPSIQNLVHDKIIPVGVVSWFLWIRDFPDWKNDPDLVRKWILSNLRKLKEYDLKQDVISFDEIEDTKDLFSPYHLFVWETLTWVSSFSLTYEHKDVDERVEIDLMPFVDDMWVWTFEVWLHNDLMKKWKNMYYFEANTLEWEKRKYKKRLNVTHEVIDLDWVELYLDPYTIKEWHKLTWKEDDFDWIDAYFMTVWCASEDMNVLVKYDHSYDFIPSCFTYSIKKNYLIYFSDMKKRDQDRSYTYTATSVKEWVLYNHFPLFQRKFWSLYQSLMFYNPWWKFLQILKAIGDETEFETLVQHYDIRTKKNTMGLRQVNWDQIEIENWYEKIIVYFYKDNTNKRSISFPWLRFKYYVMRSWRWKLINQWTLYHLQENVTVMPDATYGSSIRLGAWLHKDQVIIEDPFKHIIFNIRSLQNPIDIVDIPQLDTECSDMSAWVFGYLWDERSYLYENDTINILWKWWNVSHIKIFDNYWSIYDVNQHEQWYISSIIKPKDRWIMTWDVVFTIEWYNQNDRKVCTKEISISLHQNPF